MDSPPPYYTTVASTNLALSIRDLSNQTIKVDNRFQAIYVALKRDEKFDESSGLPSSQWTDIHKIYTNLLWSARNVATDLKTQTTELVNIIIPMIANPGETKRGKLEVLTDFINKPPPFLLTTERAARRITELKELLGPFSNEIIAGLKEKVVAAEKEIVNYEEEDEKQDGEKKEANKSHGVFGFLHPKPPPREWVDYQLKIKRLKEQIKIWQSLINDVETSIHEIVAGLDTIPDHVGSVFSSLWQHEKQDAEHIRNILEGSADGRVGDINVAADTYEQIKDALQYYSTNIIKAGSS